MKNKWLCRSLIVFSIFGCTPETSDKKDSTASDSAEDSAKRSSGSTASSSEAGEGITPPVQITGTFLFCEVIEDKITSDNSAEVGCRASNAKNTGKLDLDAVFSASGFAFQQPADPSIRVNETKADDSSNFHILYSIRGGDSKLSLDTVKKMMVMFKGRPLKAQPEQFIFSARLIEEQANGPALPEDFLVFYKDGIVTNQPAAGFEPRILPTVNRSYPDIDGCYVACYSNSSEGAAYSLPAGPGSPEQVFVMGQLRVKGYYSRTICEDGPIEDYAAECGRYLPACAGGICWGGSDTGGFFGL